MTPVARPAVTSHPFACLSHSSQISKTFFKVILTCPPCPRRVSFHKVGSSHFGGTLRISTVSVCLYDLSLNQAIITQTFLLLGTFSPKASEEEGCRANRNIKGRKLTKIGQLWSVMWFSDEQTSHCPTVVGEVPQLCRDHNPPSVCFLSSHAGSSHRIWATINTRFKLDCGSNVFVIVSLFTVI